MFLHSHLYFSQQVFGSKMNNLIALGSFLPDFSITRVVEWQETHAMEQAEKLEIFIKKTKPSYLSLVKGIKSHIVLDNFTHHHFNNKTGYAFQKSPPLIKLVSRCCRIDKQSAKVVAHNFIELAADFLLVIKKPYLVEEKKKAVNGVDKLALSSLLAPFFHKNKEKFLIGLDSFFALFLRYDLRNINDWVKFWKKVNRIKFSAEIDERLTKQAILQAIELVKDSYLDFLNEAALKYVAKKEGR